MKDGGKISMDGLVNESHNNDGLIENERQSFEYEEFNTEEKILKVKSKRLESREYREKMFQI